MQNYFTDLKLLLSIIIPARNEAQNLPHTLNKIIRVLDQAGILFELIVVDDHSNDNTVGVLSDIAKLERRVKSVKNQFVPGYGGAVRSGLEVFQGDAVAIFMADLSDDPEDIVKYYQKIREGYDCVFGTRFSSQSQVINYPWHKLMLNRMGNFLIKILFRLPYNDITNAFKCYSRRAVEGMLPLRSGHFNLTVEMPLKAIIRGYKWCVVSVNWHGRTKGLSKWKIRELGSEYLFTILYLWWENSSRGKRQFFQNHC